MSSRYDAYYRLIPSLGRDPDRADPAEKVDAARAPRTMPHPVMRRPSVLEAQHPEIVQAITLLWGHPEMNTYFEKLWLDDGNGRPLAPEAMSEPLVSIDSHSFA